MNTAALQIADLLALPAHRVYELRKRGSPIDEVPGIALVEILESSKYDRDRKDGQIEGWGRKMLP